MASTTIPNLPPLNSLTGQELVWINVNGVDYRVTAGQIGLALGGLAVFPSDPVGGFPGMVYFNSTIGNPRVYGEDGAWHTLGYI